MPVIELWRVSKITKHRDKYNKVGKSHYSYRDWEMYCRKVPLLQVLKYMPCSVEVSNAVDVSHAAESGRGVTIENGIVIDTDMHGTNQIDTTTGEIITDEKPEPKKERESKQIAQDKQDIKAEDIQIKSDEPSPEEKELIRQQLIDEANVDREIAAERATTSSRATFNLE